MRTNTKHLRSAVASFCVVLSLAGCAAQDSPNPTQEPSATESSVSKNSMETAIIELEPGASLTYYYLVFEEAARVNDYALAKEALEHLLTLAPPAKIYAEAATFYLRNNLPEAARTITSKGVLRFPNNFHIVLLHAETYRLEQKPKEAIDTIKQYIASNPMSDDAHRALGLLYLDEKMAPEAVDAFKASDDKSRTPVTRLFLAKALTQLKKYDDAIAELNKAVDERPDFIEGWAELAGIYQIKQDYVSAEQAYEQLISIDSSNKMAWLNLINLNLKLNRPRKATEIFKLGPSSKEFTLEAATMFIEEGFFAQAEEMLTPLTLTTPPAVEVYFHLALIVFERDRDMKQAIALLNNIPEKHPSWTKSLQFRSHLLYELGETDEAIKLVRKARKTDPTNRFFLELETDLLVSTKRYKEALTLTDKALKQWPNDRELLFTKGSIYHSLGDKKGALELMEKVIEMDPEHFKALNFVGYTLAETGKDLDRALALVRTASALAPNQAYILDSLAWVYYLKGDYQNAWKNIARAISLGTNDATIWEHYGDIAAKLGKLKEARKGYTNAILGKHENPDLIQQKLKGL